MPLLVNSASAVSFEEDAWQKGGMKKYVRAVLDDLKPKTKKKQTPATAQDLESQTLSKDPQQKVRQLDYQAQKSEERQRN